VTVRRPPSATAPRAGSPLEALRRLAEHLADDLDETEVVRILLDALTAALDAPFGRSILVVDGSLLIVASSDEADVLGAAYDPAWRTPAAEAIRTGAVVAVDDVAADARYPPGTGPFGSGRARAGLAVPLVYAGRVLGALAVGFAEPRTFAPDELELAAGLAGAGAVALEHARLAQQERSSRGMFETVLAQTPLGLAVTDVKGRVLFHNEAHEAIWRGFVPTNDVSGFGSWKGFHPDGRPYEPAEWPGMRCLTGESVIDEEISIVRFDGSRGVISVRAEPIRDPSGTIAGGVIAVLDVTPRHEAEAMRDAFINVLSHELRTPVTSVFGVAKLLASRWRTLDDGLREELLGDIAAESDRLQRLVEDLVVMAKVERGVDLSASEPVLLQHRVRAVAAAMREEWPGRSFVVDAPDGIPPALGDDGCVEQVLRNLFGNAAKYGRSEVRAEVRSDDDWVEVAVLDDGPGIEPADEDRVFELFYRASRTGNVPGAGIGLFVASRLAAAMDGRLSAANRPEGGAAFRFALRRIAASPLDSE
jgi:PAS domain S-box-containing protein